MTRLTFVDDLGAGAGAARAARRRLRLAWLVTVAVLVVAGAPAVADAAQTHQLTLAAMNSFGDPEGVAVDHSGGSTNGHVWVAVGSGAGFPYVMVMDQTGAGLLTGGLPTPTTAFVAPTSVAVDQATGDAYILDTGNQTIYKFSGDTSSGQIAEIWERSLSQLPDGNPFVYGAGLSLDPTSGDVVIHDIGGNAIRDAIMRIDANGDFVSEVPSLWGLASGRFAVGAHGEYFVVQRRDSGGNVGVDEYSSTGQLVRRIDDGGSQDVAYNAASDEIVVNDGTYIAIHDASGQQIDRFGTLVDGTGIAVDDSTDVVYALDRGAGYPFSYADSVNFYSPVALPDVAATPAPNPVDATSATLRGTVGLAGAGDVTSCQFEYGTSTSYGSTAVCDQPTPYSSATAVSAGVSGLSPATEYHYRLDAANGNGTAAGDDATFTTAPDVPAIDSDIVADRGSDSVRIDSHVRVMGADTRVHVEYGTSTSYGSSVPAGGRLVAASGPTDQESKLVPIQLGGLTADTTYHFRVVATSSAGTTTGSDEVFHTHALPEGLADGRHYQLVTPVNKVGHFVQPGYAHAEDSGNAVTFTTVGAVGPSAGGEGGQAVARRVNGVWTSDNVHLRPNVVSPSVYPLAQWPSDDLSKLAFSGRGFTSDGDIDGLFISTTTSTTLASPSELSPRPVGAGLPTDVFLITPAGAAPDLNPIYFAFDGALLQEDSARIPNLATDAGGFYEFKDGHVQEAGRLPDGSIDPFGAVPAGTTGTGGSHTIDFTNQTRDAVAFNNQVSADGQRAFFVSPTPGAGSPQPPQLYVHREGQASLLVSVAEGTHAPATSGVAPLPQIGASGAPESSYASASADGSHVFFESHDALTSDAPADSSVKGYLFDVDHDQIRYLPGVVGAPLGITDDGSRIYFESAAGDVDLWTDGHGVTRVAAAVGNLVAYGATDSASALVFEPVSPLPGFNNGGNIEVYRYDAAADHLECVSCPDDGTTPVGGALLAGDRRGAAIGQRADARGQLRAPHFYAEDGRRVFFDTPDQLVTTDTNTTRDVYEWEDGKIHMISRGRGSDPSWLIDNSSSGDDVFFATADALDPRDTDGGYDVYDAHVGDDTVTKTSPGACTSDCQGGGPGSASPPQPSVTSTAGRGNAAPPAGAPAAKLKVSAKSVHGSTLTLSLAVSGKGRIRVSSPSVEATSRAVTKKGTYKIAVHLTKAARTTLHRHRRMKVRLRATFTSSAGKIAATVLTLTVKA